jgi:hypothetical protein
MVDRLKRLMSAAWLLWAALMVGCSRAETPTGASNSQAGDTNPAKVNAARVATHVLTKDIAGSLVTAEQGDFIEIRLDERTPADGNWRLSRQSGDARIEAQGTASLIQDRTGMKRVFRFRALGVGTAELVFLFYAPAKASEQQTTVTFNFSIR